jgi:hypothetical protein
MGRSITKIYVFLMEDVMGNEGVITFVHNQTKKSIPGIATSEERMMKMIPWADQITKVSKMPYRIATYIYHQDVPLPKKEGDAKEALGLQ